MWREICAKLRENCAKMVRDSFIFVGPAEIARPKGTRVETWLRFRAHVIGLVMLR